jgi:hypothetical protein
MAVDNKQPSPTMKPYTPKYLKPLPENKKTIVQSFLNLYNFDDNLVRAYIATLLTLIMVVTSGFVFASYMESKTYNKLTGANTTWWDALWVELRVMESPITK